MGGRNTCPLHSVGAYIGHWRVYTLGICNEYIIYSSVDGRSTFKQKCGNLPYALMNCCSNAAFYHIAKQKHISLKGLSNHLLQRCLNKMRTYKENSKVLITELLDDLPIHEVFLSLSFVENMVCLTRRDYAYER